MAKQVTVKGTGTDGKVILWERHADHPDNGEAFIYNNGDSYTVAETPQVRRLVSEGRLVEGDSAQVRERAALRKATDEEEDRAGLTGRVEKETAVVREVRKT